MIIFPPRAYRLRLILSHVAILCKHALPDLCLTFIALGCYTECVERHYTEHLPGIAPLFRAVLRKGILLGLVHVD